MENTITYNEFLMLSLLCEYEKEFSKLPYDTQFETVKNIYRNDFEGTSRDDKNKWLYECIENFINKKNFNWKLI